MSYFIIGADENSEPLCIENIYHPWASKDLYEINPWEQVDNTAINSKKVVRECSDNSIKRKATKMASFDNSTGFRLAIQIRR